ncbi:hypothetical protein [Gemmiger formicilis]|uniref:hypothetical protein n=1 Tax=Gemmiger formicilis TaxID=745368 RepID=UPI003FD84975
MKKMKKLVSVLLVACSMLLLVACGGKSEDKLVGTWQDSYGEEIAFYEDGTYTKDGEYGTGKWSILSNGDIKFVDFYGTTYTSPCELDGNSLTLTDGRGTRTYSKS